jgi:hypothetical protein
MARQGKPALGTRTWRCHATADANRCKLWSGHILPDVSILMPSIVVFVCSHIDLYSLLSNRLKEVLSKKEAEVVKWVCVLRKRS